MEWIETMLTRREFLASTALAMSVPFVHGEGPARARSSLGIVLDSYAIRMRAEKDRGFTDPLRFLEFCGERGAAGVQLPLGAPDAEAAKKLRAAAEQRGMYLEGSIRPPKDEAGVARFAAEVKAAREAGADVLRTVLQGGRRYEVFHSADDFRAFDKQARHTLELAEPVVARQKMRLAVENHKDYRAGELAELMRRMSSEWLGVCVDTGNNLALLEPPRETVETLAPWAYSCHFKDMAVEEYADGFYLSEVPLGEGFLDLPRLAATLRKARPGVRLGLEMITRDPLKIPCLTEGYWTTLDEMRGREAARGLALVRKQSRKLPRVTGLNTAEQLELEDGNVRRCLETARKLGL